MQISNNLVRYGYRTVIALLAMIVMLTLVVTGAAQTANEADAQILAYASEITNTPEEQLEVINVAEAYYDALGMRASVAKVYDVANDRMLSVFVDGNRNLIERNLNDEELEAEIANGPLHSAVEARLAAAEPDELVSVAFWVPSDTVPMRPDMTNRSDEEIEAAESQFEADYAVELADAKVDFLNTLEQTGYEAEYISPVTPLIAVKAPASMIQELSRHPDIVHVFLNEGQNQDHGVGDGDPVRSSRGYRAHKFFDLSAAGRQVGVIECCGSVYYSSAWSGHPYIMGINTNASCSSEDHATAVTGFIASSHTTHRGQAYNAHINFDSPCDGSVGGGDTATDWVIGSGGNFSDPINHSYGLDTNRVVGSVSQDAHRDSATLSSLDLHVVSAGNNCNGYGSGTCNVGSPGVAYNVLTVGNINDQQTWSWGDDTMSVSSSYIDPISTHSDRNKPEVSAAGTSLDSATTSSPWIGSVGSGTSYSAPVVTAAAAVLHEADTIIASWPEETKALLMATAWHDNADGVGGMSDEDGAGSIDAFRATQVAFSDTGGDTGHQTVSCSDTFPITLGTFAVASGNTIRVAMAWSTDPNYADYADQPSSDLDLRVEGPGGFSQWSSSWDNTYEFLQFDTTSTGQYTVKLYSARCSEPSGDTPLGWAWARSPY